MAPKFILSLRLRRRSVIVAPTSMILEYLDKIDRAAPIFLRNVLRRGKRFYVVDVVVFRVVDVVVAVIVVTVGT